MYRASGKTFGFVALLTLMSGVLIHAHPSTAGGVFSLVHFGQLPEAPAAIAADSVPYTLSTRVGTEIDRDERTYFHLFPAVRGFDKASTLRKSTGDIAFIITRRDTAGIVSDTTVIVSSETAEQIAVFIDNYEPICSRKRNFNFPQFKDYIRLPAISCTTTRPVVVVMTDGTEYVAQILHAADSTLVLWTGDGIYDWQPVGDNAVFLPYHKINAVVYKKDARFKRAMTCGGLGCLVGAGAGALMAAGLEAEPTEDPWDFGWFAVEWMRRGLPLLCAMTGGLVGGVTGAVTGAGEGSNIRADRQAYYSARERMNQHAIFPYSIPPEIRSLLEVNNSSTGN